MPVPSPATTRPMRAVVHHVYGPPEVLTLADVARPSPGPGDVVIRVAAAVVSRAEAHMRAADPPVARLATGLRRPRHAVPGGELAGEVLAVGSGVTELAPGDRVVAVSLRGGGYAEEACVPDAGTVRVPDDVPLEDAAAVVEGGLTALPFLRDHGRVGQGTRLLVHGAAGAVGAMAVQLGVHLGAHVTAVCSTRNLDLVRSLGAHRVLDRTAEDFTAAPGAYDVVLDAVGTSSYARARHALSPHGRYLTTVPSARVLGQMLVTRLRPGRRATLATTGLRPVDAKRTDMVHLLDLAARGVLRAVVDRVLPLAGAVEAHRYVDTGRKRGAVLLRP